MTDRELLELAAKAASVPQRVVGAEPGLYFLYKDRDGVDGSHLQWNPLTDDGDALRLALSMSITIDQSKLRKLAIVSYWNGCKWNFHDEDASRDLFAATRRAIVRAAAEIGRSE